jgi:hypothetical protein
MKTDVRATKLKELYDAVPDGVKNGDLQEALDWARETLTKHEGSGHHFQLVWTTEGLMCCFAKPEWGGDHPGTPREEASDAIVYSVCEYLAGY